LAQLPYGDVMTVWMGREPWLVLQSPEAVHEAFVEKGSDFSGRPMVTSMGISAGGGEAGFAKAVPDRALGQLRRTAFSQLFSAAQVERAQAEFDAEARLLAEHLLVSSDSASLRSSLRRCVQNMVLRFAFSTRVAHPTEEPPSRLSTDTAPFGTLLELTDAIWSELTATSTFVSDLLGVPADSAVRDRLRNLVSERNALLVELIEARRVAHARGGNGARADAPRNDMLDVLLVSGLPPEDVLFTLVDLFVAGVNTVSTTLEWTLLLGAEFPLEQARARAVATRSVGGGSGGTPTTALSYVDALTNEVLRYKPPLLLPRMAVRDTSVGGFAVPSGHVVFANHWALTRSEAHWRDPTAFRPERWRSADEEAGFGAARGASACKFLPYSIGQRACPGQRLAQAELHAATTALLATVRWRRMAPIDLSEDFGLTLAPAVEQRLRFERVERRAAPRRLL
jgi:cytochrome P450